MRVTLLTCTPDTGSELFVEHASAIKKYTHNYEWLIVDNNLDFSFNHAREMNRALRMTSNKYLVTLDDDLIVSEGWLEALLEAAKSTNIVGGVHRHRNGTINHAGGYILPNGVAGHFLGEVGSLTFVEYVSSAAMLIDIEYVRRNSMDFDEGYSKFFHETDLCLKIWESGGTVAITSKCDVIHLVGQVVGRLSDRARLYYNDFQHFRGEWIDNGRLKILISRIESKLDSVYFSKLKRLYQHDKEYRIAKKGGDIAKQRELIDALNTYTIYDSAIRLINRFTDE
jgi:GT2 family glycosyltransferase